SNNIPGLPNLNLPNLAGMSPQQLLQNASLLAEAQKNLANTKNNSNKDSGEHLKTPKQSGRMTPKVSTSTSTPQQQQQQQPSLGNLPLLPGFPNPNLLANLNLSGLNPLALQNLPGLQNL